MQALTSELVEKVLERMADPTSTLKKNVSSFEVPSFFIFPLALSTHIFSRQWSFFEMGESFFSPRKRKQDFFFSPWFSAPWFVYNKLYLGGLFGVIFFPFCFDYLYQTNVTIFLWKLSILPGLLSIKDSYTQPTETHCQYSIYFSFVI